MLQRSLLGKALHTKLRRGCPAGAFDLARDDRHSLARFQAAIGGALWVDSSVDLLSAPGYGAANAREKQRG